MNAPSTTQPMMPPDSATSTYVKAAVQIMTVEDAERQLEGLKQEINSIEQQLNSRKPEGSAISAYQAWRHKASHARRIKLTQAERLQAFINQERSGGPRPHTAMQSIAKLRQLHQLVCALVEDGVELDPQEAKLVADIKEYLGA